MDFLDGSRAYKYVAIVAMLLEINYCSGRLGLAIKQPVKPSDLQSVYISSPYVTGFGGTLETKDYSFVFLKSGRLRRIQRINKFEKIPLRQRQLKLARQTSLIDSNGAYGLATNWLSAISVDVKALEVKHNCWVEQKFFYPDATNLGDELDKKFRKVMLPIFHVCWGDRAKPAVIVSVFGPTKELLALYQNDDSFSSRPSSLITNEDKLLAIPDEEFSKFSPSECSNLVARSLVVTYSFSNKFPVIGESRVRNGN